MGYEVIPPCADRLEEHAVWPLLVEDVQEKYVVVPPLLAYDVRQPARLPPKLGVSTSAGQLPELGVVKI